MKAISKYHLGVNGKALAWFKAYFTDHAQCVSILRSKSEKVPLTRGVPQGSILGPIAFTTYTLPLGDIARKDQLGFHVYTDDMPIYLSFDQNDPNTAPIAINSLEVCISENSDWMRHNKLKLNDDKTDILLFPSCHPRPFSLVVTLDSSMSLAPHITNICKASNYHLYRIS